MLEETAAAPIDPPSAESPPAPGERFASYLVPDGNGFVHEIDPNLLMPEAVQGEGGPLALAGDPPQSTNTEIAAPPAEVPAPPAPAEQTVDFGKGVRVPVAQVRSFFNPTCTLHCQEGVLVRAGAGSLCFCALKRCRDAIVGSRSTRATARPLPGVSTQVNPRELESVDKLSERAARLDAQIAEKDQAAAGEIAALIAQAETCDGAATLYTLEIRQAEEGLEVLAQRRRDREQELRDIADAAADVTARLGAARVNEDEIVRQAVALRRQAVVLEGKRDQRTAGMRNARERLGRRIAIKLARAPRVEMSPAPAPNLCSHGVLIGDHCAGCQAAQMALQVENGAAPPLPALDAPVVESSSAPATAGDGVAFMLELGRLAAATSSVPLEVTPVVELLDDGTPLGCAPGPAEEPAA